MCYELVGWPAMSASIVHLGVRAVPKLWTAHRAVCDGLSVSVARELHNGDQGDNLV